MRYDRPIGQPKPRVGSAIARRRCAIHQENWPGALAQPSALPHEFRPQPWADLLAGVSHDSPRESLRWIHIEQIVQSIIGSGLADRLAGRLSLSGFDVADRSTWPAESMVGAPPVEVIRVYTPWCDYPSPPGRVTIEHITCTGRNDRITRDTSDAVPLFWRFVSEKFGVAVAQSNQGSD